MSRTAHPERQGSRDNHYRDSLMTNTDTTRTAVIVATNGTLFDHVVESAGLRVVGVSPTAVLGEKLVSITEPDVIVVENELPGEQGIESLGHLRKASPKSEVVLVVPDDLVEVESGLADAYAVLPKGRLCDLEPLLRTLNSRIGDHRVAGNGTDRRSGVDRRVIQDWSKVGWEKRDGSDRRLAATA